MGKFHVEGQEPQQLPQLHTHNVQRLRVRVCVRACSPLTILMNAALKVKTLETWEQGKKDGVSFVVGQ